MVKKIVSLVVATSLLAGALSGCGSSVLKGDATKIALQNPITKQEVLDYYARAMKYDTIINRDAKADINNYETTEVTDGSKKAILKDSLAKTESLLMGREYNKSEENMKYLPESTYHYIKAMLNDKKLTNHKLLGMKQALGYYFVDVEYDITPATIGKFKATSSLLGISGSFKINPYDKSDLIDNNFLTAAAVKLNKYYMANGLYKTANYDSGSQTFTTSKNGGSQTGFDNTVNDIVVPVEDPTLPVTDPALPVTDPTLPVDGNTPEIETPVEKPVSSRVVNSRTTGVDLVEFNRVVGYSDNKAYIPDLNLIYDIPASSNGIQGIGLMPSGDGGLKIFGMSRDSLAGKMNLRFVYKEGLINPSEIKCENVYCTFYEITSGYNAENNNIIPDFLTQDFEVLVERADRAMVDCDISGLMSGNIFADMGVGVLRGYEERYSNLLRQITTLRKIISRDIDSNAYLVELETYRKEGPASADVYANYKDKVYAVIEQKGSSFVITDYMIMSRQLVMEPDINPDASTAKRIVSLGLTGEISDETKESAVGLINDLYMASTNRVLRGPYDTGSDDQKVTHENGMYDCFNSNVEMLSSSKLEKINSNLRSALVKYGIDMGSQVQGKVTEWIGGTTNQVEFTTEEVITYQGRNDGVYTNCYYLLSNMEDKWVIDDMQILDQTELSGEGLQAVIDRIVK